MRPLIHVTLFTVLDSTNAPVLHTFDGHEQDKDRMMDLRKALVLLLLLGLQGCASSSIFSSYPNQANAWTGGLSQGTPAAGLDKLSEKAASNDSLLYLQELARMQQLDGQNEASRDTFDSVFSEYEEVDAQARIRASGLAASTASLLTNDNALPYQGYAYERIMGHAFQAFNYLALTDIAGAGVEVRRAALEQRTAELEHEKQIDKAEQDAEENDVDVSQYEGYFSGVNAAAAGVTSAITNAWAYYFSGAYWEGVGEYNDALVDYKKALSIAPNVEFIKADIERVSKKLDRRWPSDKGIVVILHEQGLVPAREEIMIPIPTIHGYFSVAFPVYSGEGIQAPIPLHAQSERETVSTEVLVRLNGTAAKALKDKIPSMVVRQTLRAAAKYGAQKQANEQLGLFGGLATQIYNLVSERADLRSWLTLPAYAMATRMELPAGNQVIKLSASGGSASVNVPVLAGGITLLRVIEVGSYLRTEVYPIPEGRK